MESKGTTVVAHIINEGLTGSYRYTTLADATLVPLFTQVIGKDKQGAGAGKAGRRGGRM